MSCVLFLRAINVGGSNIIKMKDLCQRFEESGHFSHVKSYLQTGNVVINISPDSVILKENSLRDDIAIKDSERGSSESSQKTIDSDKLLHIVNDIIRTHFHCEPVVIIRQYHELQEVLDKIPFSYEEPKKVQVHFLDSVAQSVEGRDALEKYDKGPEIVKVFDREVYVHYVEGIGNSKFNRVPLEKMLKANATARNLNSIRSVLKIAQEMAELASSS
jgi:uncharacterized protein (DUF1697 family)